MWSWQIKAIWNLNVFVPKFNYLWSSLGLKLGTNMCSLRLEAAEKRIKATCLARCGLLLVAAIFCSSDVFSSKLIFVRLQCQLSFGTWIEKVQLDHGRGTMLIPGSTLRKNWEALSFIANGYKLTSPTCAYVVVWLATIWTSSTWLRDLSITCWPIHQPKPPGMHDLPNLQETKTCFAGYTRLSKVLGNIVEIDWGIDDRIRDLERADGTNAWTNDIIKSKFQNPGWKRYPNNLTHIHMFTYFVD